MPAGMRQTREGEALREQLVDAIEDYTELEGQAPTQTQLAQLLGVSRQTVQHHVAILIRERRVADIPSRGLRIVG